LISIRKATDELDRLEGLTRALTSTYEHAIWSTAQYAIEIDLQAVTSFREHLNNLRDQSARAISAEDWQLLQASFRGELRDFRDKSTQQLIRMRSEFTAAVSAMQSFADSVASTGENHEDDLRNVLGELTDAAKSDDIAFVRTVIGTTAAVIDASVEHLRKSHQLSIAQLRDEIRVLQHQVEIEHQASQIDHATGSWNRQKMDETFATFTDRDEPFSLLILCIRNLRWLGKQYSRSMIDGAMRAFVQRLTAMLDETAVVGRWDEECFAALLPIQPAEAMRISREAAMRLTGTYSVQNDGAARQIALVVVTGVIEHAPGSGHAAFAKRMEQMSTALAAA